MQSNPVAFIVLKSIFIKSRTWKLNQLLSVINIHDIKLHGLFFKH